jgi:hypothetical protein
MKKTMKYVASIFLMSMVLFTGCDKSDVAENTANPQSVDFRTTQLTQIEADMSAAYTEMGSEQIMQCIYDCLNSMPVEELSENEIEALTFVREEELLAHDVYQALYALFPVPVFNHISKSELLHAYAMKVLLDKYNLPDPAENHVPGVFTNQVIQQLYDDLVAFGSQNIENALIVGATIEDVDINDLINHLENDIDNQDLTYAIEQLYKGSRNHLRAFNAHLVFRNITYIPQYISQDLFDSITGSPWEFGSGFCICNCNVSVNTDEKISR